MSPLRSLSSSDERKTLKNTLLYIYLGVLTAFPFLISGILQYCFENLDNPVYLMRMESIYLEIKRNRLALTYTTVFCLRRLMLALLILDYSGMTIPLL